MERERESIIDNFKQEIKKWQGKLCPLELMQLGLLNFVEPFELLSIEPIIIKIEDYFEILKYAMKRNRELLYLWHMELSGHSQTLLKLCRGQEFASPMLYLGCGVGSNLWWLWYEGSLPPGRISLLDIDPKMIDYARSLMADHRHTFTLEFNDAFDDEPPEYWYVYIPNGRKERHIPETRPSQKRIEKEHDFTFHVMDGCEIADRVTELGGPFQSVFSVMALQWVDDPERMIQAVYQSLQPGGRFVLVGEDDPDAVAPTALIFPLDLPKGTDFQKIEKACEDVGLRRVDTRRAEVSSEIRPRSLMSRMLILPKKMAKKWMEKEKELVIGEKAGGQILFHVQKLDADTCAIYVHAQTHTMVLTVWEK